MIELLQSLLHTQIVTSSSLVCLSCTGKSYTAVAAALATQGYYLQANILENFFFFGMENWTILLYVCAAIGGLVSAALGAPPKTYLWFFMGPAVYHWLIGNTTTTFGNHWMVGFEQRDQREVWKLARQGLANSSYLWRYGIAVDNRGPRAPAEVADLFAWFDDVVSDTVQQLVTWTGVAYMERRYFGPGTFSSTWLGIGGGGLGFGGIAGGTMNHADLLSGLKWTYLTNITDARISNMNLRDAWGLFIGGECGEKLRENVDGQAMSRIANARGRALTASDSLFGGSWNPLGGVIGPVIPPSLAVGNALRGASFPTKPLRKYLIPDANFINESGLQIALSSEAVPLPIATTIQTVGTINCATYFDVVMAGMRLEAYNIAQQMVANRPHPDQLSPTDFVQALFAGWDIPGIAPGVPPVTNIELQSFLTNLILIHLVRNELIFASKGVATLKYLAGDQIERSFTRESIRGPASKQKYSELYSWALMVPWFQGLVLFILAAAYPFACALTVVPGWHKAIFTWMSFWLWAKLWDLGFAMVALIERSIWAGLGNSVDMASFYSIIAGGLNPATGMLLNNTIFPDAVPGTPRIATAVPFLQNFMVFDRALLLSFNNEFDVANSFYIYIMAALYFAVPAVFGQLVLGAKAGLGNMLSQPLGQIADATTRNVGNAFQDVHQRSALEQARLGTYANKMSGALKQDGLFARSVAAQNDQFFAGTDAAIQRQKKEGIENALRVLGMGKEMADQSAGLLWAAFNSGKGLYGQWADGRMLGQGGPGAEGSASPGSTTGPGGLGAVGDKSRVIDALKGAAGGLAGNARQIADNAIRALENAPPDKVGQVLESIGHAASYMTASMRYENAKVYNDAAAGVVKVGQDISNQAAHRDLQGRVLNNAGDRYGAMANAELDMDAWRFQRDVGNHVGPTLSSWGTFAGTTGANELNFNPMGAVGAFASDTSVGAGVNRFSGGLNSSAMNDVNTGGWQAALGGGSGRGFEASILSGDKVSRNYSHGWNENIAPSIEGPRAFSIEAVVNATGSAVANTGNLTDSSPPK